MKKKRITFLAVLSVMATASVYPAGAMPKETTVPVEESLIEQSQATENDENEALEESTDEAVPETLEEDPENTKEEPEKVLTPDQVAAGYTIVDGKVIAPTQAGVTHYGGVESGNRTGYCTFLATLPEGVHGNVYLTMINLRTYETYQTVIYEQNKWVSTISLPEGRYIFDESGLLNDEEKKYYAITKEFTVRRASNVVVSIDIHDSKKENESVRASIEESRESVAALKDAMTAEETSIWPDGKPIEIGKTTEAGTEPAEYETSDGSLLPKQHKKMNVLNLIFAIIFLVIPGAGCLLYMRTPHRSKKHKDPEF